MGSLTIREFETKDELGIIGLWLACGLVVPWNDPHKDIQRKMRIQNELFLVGENEKEIVATVMAGYEGHRGWINYLAVQPEKRGFGFGKAMMAEAEMRLRALGCPKIQLQVRESNEDVIDFYQKLGYVIDPVLTMGKRLEEDDFVIPDGIIGCTMDL